MWESELEGLVARIRPLFYRTESIRHAEQYVRGLLARIERKNSWTIAEHVGEPEPKALQRLLNLSPGMGRRLLELNREYAMEQLAEPGAILVADRTGFLKKGACSVGVQREYTGTAGRIENSQVAVFLTYASPRGRALVDRRLYLPRTSWRDDPERRAAAGVPDEIAFATKPELAQQMVGAALDAGSPPTGSPVVHPWASLDGGRFELCEFCPSRRSNQRSGSAARRSLGSVRPQQPVARRRSARQAPSTVPARRGSRGRRQRRPVRRPCHGPEVRILMQATPITRSTRPK